MLITPSLPRAPNERQRIIKKIYFNTGYSVSRLIRTNSARDGYLLWMVDEEHAWEPNRSKVQERTVSAGGWKIKIEIMSTQRHRKRAPWIFFCAPRRDGNNCEAGREPQDSPASWQMISVWSTPSPENYAWKKKGGKLSASGVVIEKGGRDRSEKSGYFSL